MKKIIGIFSIALIAGTMFFNINLLSKSNTDVDLASLIATSVANAEDGGQNGCFYTSYWLDECAQFPIYKPMCEPSYMFLCN